MDTMLSVRVRTAIGSSASARLGMPMSSRAANKISVPGAELRHCHEPSKTAMSPSSWRNVMRSAPGWKVSSSVQRSRPARKVTSQRDTARFSDTSVTVTSRTASLSWGYRSKSASVAYTSPADWCGTCRRRRTVRIVISFGLRNSRVARGFRSSCARTAATAAGWQ
jgi:hypothetical protein